VQDYHFALLPRMIRELPQATIITFWHIPWPNPESFAICPWRDEILAGMLGSSILGFHTQFHCNNFVDTWTASSKPAWIGKASRCRMAAGSPRCAAIRSRSPGRRTRPCWRSPSTVRRRVARKQRLAAGHRVCIGVDRLDYTKGILERFRAVERLLELNPARGIGRFSLLQIAAPSRASIEDYQNHDAQVRALATRINERFVRGERKLPPPILLKVEHHDAQQVHELYRGADCCFVSSLHDGMNLVAKEYVAARDDERGVLILSQFTGAARELPEALIVNPYDIEQCAAALHLA
jgi:trehalose 6-phosphate synthase